MAIAVVAIMALGSLGLAAGLVPSVPTSHAPATGTAASPPSTVTSTPAPSASSAPAASASSSTFNAGSAAASRALAATQAAGISPRDVFVPRPSATTSQIQSSASQGHVVPLYSATPAPIGLADFGLSQNPSTGDISPSILNTTSVQGTFDPAAVNGPNATDLADSSPDGYGVQLNAVATGITLFGNDSYQFWTQNVIEYFPYGGIFYIVSNVWNFSSSAGLLSLNVFYQTSVGPGCIDQQVGTQYYYSECGPYQISYPFNLTLTMTSGITGGRNAVSFSLNATSPNGSMDINDANYDVVVFNSTASTTPPLTQPANYTANGYQYNPLGLTNDFELTIGGPGGGSQTTFLTAQAQESLSYWDATAGSYEAVPSAFSYGGETGETSVGAGMSWTTGSTGQPIAFMSTGPSLMGGLWNASSPAGGPGTLALNVNPGNAFILVSYTGASSTAFNITEPEWAPTVYANQLTLPAGTYNISVGLADYVPQYFGAVTVAPSSSGSLTANLVWAPSEGVYTPLWAWSNAQIGNISTSGSGTISSPYVVVNNQLTPLGSFFGVLNDYAFPVFPGVYLIGTTAYTEFASPPSLAVYTAGGALPAMNNLPYWFYDTSNVAIVNATGITGWFSTYAYDYPYFLTDNVEFWNSTNMLIANDTFNSEAQALLLYNGYTSANPLAAGDATVWGNTFLQAPTPEPSTILVPASAGLGLSEQENFDLIYNNYFQTPTTAASFPIDLYFGYLTAYNSAWNITPTASSVVNYDSNWPAFALTGSIIGGATQGGNYWWDYGLTYTGYYLVQAAFPPLLFGYNSNPFGVLPYTETGWIDPFGLGIGDFAPLLYSPLASVTLTATGLSTGVTWNYTVSNVLTGDIYWTGSTSVASATFLLTNGTYQLDASAFGYSDISETLTVRGATSVTLAFTAVAVAVRASPATGLAADTLVTFSVVVGTSSTGTALLYLGPSAGGVRAEVPIAVTGGQGSTIAVPGLLLAPGESSLSFWVTFGGSTSSVGTLSFATPAPPSTLTLSVSTGTGGISTFSIASDGSNVVVTLWAHSASGVLLAELTVGLGTDGTGSILLNTGLLPSGTVWVVTYGSVTSNTVTT